VEVARLVETARAASRAIQQDFAPQEVAILKEAVVRATPELAGSAERSLDAVRSGCAHLDALARGIQGYTAATEPEPFDINQAVLSAMQLLSHRLRQTVRLERDLQAVPMVRCRGPEITQVVLNLLSNAADAVQKVSQPTIQVRTRRDGSLVRLEVADNGAGFDPLVAQQMFRPLNSGKSAGEERGFGLSICKSIVESHGGNIEAGAEGSRGTRFTVTLPAIAAS
jgi:C4-dicarboxylate-specific signal transduction histidine kinase